MRKKVPFGAKPQTPAARGETPDDWVSAATNAKPTGEPIPMKRLTIDIPESLHRHIKTQCASRGLRMADEIRTLLEGHFLGIEDGAK